MVEWEKKKIKKNEKEYFFVSVEKKKIKEKKITVIFVIILSYK